MKKIQVGKDVWIKPSNHKACDRISKYYYVNSHGLVAASTWHFASLDYSFMNSGNFFLKHEESMAAIIKPVDKTSISYDQWVSAGKLQQAFIVFGGEVCLTRLNAPLPIDFETQFIWLTSEAAQAWIDDFNENNPGEVRP